MRQFTKPYQVMFVMDPLERVNSFYTVNPGAITPSERMAEISGYFIYYEKNINMHEYMLTNKSVGHAAKPPTFVELTPIDPGAPEIPDDDYDTIPDGYQPMTHTYEEDFDERGRNYTPHSSHEHDLEPEDIIRRRQINSVRRRGERVEQKRASSLLGGLCAVLFIVSFVMGVGLVRNQDRIDRLEGELRQLATAHRNLFAQMSTPEFTPVFAEATPTTVPNYGVPVNTTSPPHVYQTSPPTTTTNPIATTQPQTTQPATTAYTATHDVLVPAIPATYTIQPGDSLIAISIQFFGDASMVNEILALNGIENPDMIVAGRTIALPSR